MKLISTGSLHSFTPPLCFSLTSLSLFPTPKAQCPYMVQLLHHYETQTNRIFLLLEHIHSGRLIDHVLSLRQVHKKNTTPPIDQGKTPQAEREEKEENKDVSYDREDSEELLTKKLASLEVVTSEPIASDTGEEEEEGGDPNMDKMLEELMSIDTPTNRVGRRSRRKKSPSPSNPEEDSLTRRRRLLMETMSESGPAESGRDNEEAEDKKKKMEREAEELNKEEDHTQSTGIPRLSLHPDGAGSSETDTQINVIPPTPTTPRQPADPTSPATTNDDRLSSPSESSSQPTATDAAAKTGSSSSSRRSSGQCTPQFSPASLRNSPEPSLLADEVAIQLETAIREWAAQIVVALEHLHSNSIVYQ